MYYSIVIHLYFISVFQGLGKAAIKSVGFVRGEGKEIKLNLFHKDFKSLHFFIQISNNVMSLIGPLYYSVADPVNLFRIRIQVTQKRPDPDPDPDPT